MADMASSIEVQKALQAVAQGLQWTYALLWQLCPDQGPLVWAEGHYNGAIKTRKTVQSTAAAAAAVAQQMTTETEAVDQAARHRSRQLQELFESLAREAATACRDHHGGVHDPPAAARRPSAALAPEDLTETEWFYLMSASYSFPPGVGLPGKAFAWRRHVWLSRANGIDSKTFSRAILAKSAGIQTVVCIPIVDGVLEIGTTEKVEEDIGVIQYAKRMFIDKQDIHMIPTISEHSTSNQITHIDQQPFQTQLKIHTGQEKVQPSKFSPEYGNNEMEEAKDEIDTEYGSGSETNNRRNCWEYAPVSFISPDQETHNAGNSALAQLEVSERVKDGCSSNLDDDIQMLMVSQNSNDRQDEPCQSWHFLYEDLCSGDHQSAEDQAMNLPENAHYSKTVLSILEHKARRQANMNIKSYLTVSHRSSFCGWDPTMQKCMITQGTPQRMLKSILFFGEIGGHNRQTPDPRDGGGGVTGQPREGDLSTNHVLKERRRREKLSERFITLRSLVPFVTKMDKASILGDTIEYVKQLRKRIHDLESAAASTQVHGDLAIRQLPAAVSAEKKTSCGQQRCAAVGSVERRHKLRAVEGSSTGSSAPVAVAVAVQQHSTDVQVSIIESDALVEVRCPYGSGLLVQIMQAVQWELQLEITSVQASSDGGVLVAELRAKVKEVHGRRSSSISEVKRAIHLIISLGSM